jgi:glycerol kinase
MTDHQILGLMAFTQVILVIYGIVELRRAAGLFKAGIELVTQTVGDISRQMAASSKELAELVRVEGEKVRDELRASSVR